ncbi:MAG: hypothetical protein IJ341_02400 [Bacteroidales bacterium]|nr:hypothetical protein [Bacteroidales bacterium]
MKNINPNQLKTCIYLSSEELEEILSEIYEQKISVHIALDGPWYESENADLDIDNNDVINELSDYFDVEGISIHSDDGFEHPGIWIVYKEN